MKIKQNEMTIDQYIQDLPPSSINNTRSILRRKLSLMSKRPSESLGNEIEEITGISYDWSDKDHGEAPKYK